MAERFPFLYSEYAGSEDCPMPEDKRGEDIRNVNA